MDHVDPSRKLDEAYDCCERVAPERVARALRWVRQPTSRWVRTPLGVTMFITGFFGFLPVIGYWFIPVGLLLVAHDVPVLRLPVANGTLWLLRKWDARPDWCRRRGDRA